jgi:transcriptional regulator with XRE-family HTH domain
MAVRERGYLNKVLGQRIKEARVAAGFTLEGLAKKCGVGFNTIYKMEQGSVNITVDRLVAVSKATNVAVITLLKGLT